MIKTRVYKLFIFIFFVVTFDGCGPSDDTNWGVDHEKNEVLQQKLSKKVPTCNGDKRTTTNSVKVYAKQEIEQTTDKTVLRIWHYQNGDKRVCTVTGEAVIIYEK